MVVITSVIVVISAVSLYEFYSEKDWAQVTSQSRNNVVFEKRNQKYGAFEIRQNYDRKVMYILFGLIFSIASLYGGYRFFKKPIDKIIENGGTEIDPFTNICLFSTTEPEQKEEEEEEKQKEPESKPTKVDVVAPLEFVNEKVKSNLDIEGKNPTGPVAIPGPVGGGGGTETGTPTPPPVPTPPVVNNTPRRDPNTRAKYPGGESERQRFLIKNIEFPESGLDGGGKCYLEFIVDEKGEISSVKILKGVPFCKECDQEAMRVVKKMPRWEPAIDNGEKVPSYYTMVINFLVN